MPFGRLDRFSVRFLCSTALVAVVFLTSCGSSDPVIVSGTIDSHGAAVKVTLYVPTEVNDPIDQQKPDGQTFELRGEMSTAQARALRLGVGPIGYNFTVCDAHLSLPPLQISEGRWVNARTGKPLVLKIELRETIDPFARPLPSYSEMCPDDSPIVHSLG